MSEKWIEDILDVGWPKPYKRLYLTREGLERLLDAGLLLTPAQAKAMKELRDVAAMAYGWIADRQPHGESLATKLNKSILAVDAVTEEEAKP